MIRLDYIFTGTGRCGTVYYAHLLSSLGIPCSHEGIFRPDEFILDRLNGKAQIVTSDRSREYDSSWAGGICLAESSYMSAPYLDLDVLKSTKVVHLIRHPLRVISSYMFDLGYYKYAIKGKHSYMDYVYDHLPCLIEEKLSTVHRITKFYLEWNKLIVTKCVDKMDTGKYLLHKIEDGCEPVLEWLGIKPTETMYADERANTMKHRIDCFSLDQIPPHPIKDELCEFANRHGYDLSGRGYVPKLFI